MPRNIIKTLSKTFLRSSFRANTKEAKEAKETKTKAQDSNTKNIEPKISAKAQKGQKFWDKVKTASAAPIVVDKTQPSTKNPGEPDKLKETKKETKPVDTDGAKRQVLAEALKIAAQENQDLNIKIKTMENQLYDMQRTINKKGVFEDLNPHNVAYYFILFLVAIAIAMLLVYTIKQIGMNDVAARGKCINTLRVPMKNKSEYRNKAN